MTAINKLRQSQGLTIKQFADVLGISYALTKSLLYGQRQPSIKVLRRIRNAFPNQNLGDYIDD